MNEEQVIDKVSMIDQWKVSGDSYTQGELDAIGQLLELYYDYKKELEQEKEKNKELEEKLKIATAMLTKGTYPEKNKGDNDFDKQFISKNKIMQIVNECLEKKPNVITGKEEYCFNVNDNSFLAHRIVELLEEV